MAAGVEAGCEGAHGERRGRTEEVGVSAWVMRFDGDVDVAWVFDACGFLEEICCRGLSEWEGKGVQRGFL